MKNENLENQVETEKPSFYDFARKSIVGAVYRVGVSFALDGIFLTVANAVENVNNGHGYLESVAMATGDYLTNFDPEKFARISAWVVGINFGDYKFDITNRLDRTSKKLQDGIFGKTKCSKDYSKNL